MVDYRILIDIRSGFSGTPLIKEDNLERRFVDGCEKWGFRKVTRLVFLRVEKPSITGIYTSSGTA